MTTAMSNVTDMMTTNATDVCSDDAIICIDFIKGDFMQSLQLALIVIMMQLAIYCLVYPFYSKISSSMCLYMNDSYLKYNKYNRDRLRYKNNKKYGNKYDGCKGCT